MPIFMDIHIVPGVRAKEVAEAHRMDLLYQDQFECKCMTYWIDEQRENVFCLIEAPDKESVEEMHSKAHGLVPNKVIEVSSALVESFLGRIYDPSDAKITDGIKVFSDPSYRVLLVIRTADAALLRHKYGMEKTNKWLNTYHDVVRKHAASFEGREAEHEGPGFIISFTSASKAVACAQTIQQEIPAADAAAIDLRLGLSAGEPIEKSNKLFGDTIHLAEYLCAIGKTSQIAIATTVKELVMKDHPINEKNRFMCLQPQDEAILKALFAQLEENWQNADFDIDDYCQAMAMSKSQLYRKAISLTGFSPNILLKEFRLEKAKELMRKQQYPVSQITFEAGFTSPSYFTKCFKKKYGVLPMAYLDLLH